MPKKIDTVAALRTLALARGQRMQPVHLILDDEIRDDLAELNKMLDDLNARKEEGEYVEPDSDGMLGDTPQKGLDQLIGDTLEARDALEKQAADEGKVLVVNFRRLDPELYQQIVDDCEAKIRETAADDAVVPLIRRLTDAIGKAAAPQCYAGCTTPDGEDLNISWQELLNYTITHADLDEIESHCILINRSGAAVDFHQRSSGSAPMS